MLLKDKVVGSEFLNPQAVAEAAWRILKIESPIDRDKEHFWVFGLNTRNVVKYVDLVSLGILNGSLVHPREVFRLAVIKGIASVVLCHNHPSDNTQPSEEDLVLTKRLAKSGKILGIDVTDHLIIPNKEGIFFSFRKKNLI